MSNICGLGMAGMAFVGLAACQGHPDAVDTTEQTSSALVDSCSAWSATWSQGAGANSWWIEYAIGGGEVSAAWLDVNETGRSASYPLRLKWGKWSSTAAKISTGAPVVLRAQDSYGRIAFTQAFRYLVDENGTSAPCMTWDPTWVTAGGANNWWAEFAIGSAEGNPAEAYIEVPNRANVALHPHVGKWAASLSQRIETGTVIVLHAKRADGQVAASTSFRYLVDAAADTASNGGSY